MTRSAVKSLSALAFLLCTRPARAQVAESIAAVSSDYYPSTRGPNPRQEVGVDVFRANVGYPIVLSSKKWILLPSLSYERLHFRTEGLKISPDSLHAPMVAFGVLRVLSPHVMVLASASAGFATDFARPVEGKDLVVTAMLLGIYRVNDKLSIGAGVGYDRRTGNLLPLPALPIRWRISQNFRLRGAVPAFLAGEYHTASWLTSGLRASFEGNRYHLSDPAYGKEDLQLAYSVVSLSPRLTFHFGKLTNLDLYASVPVFRRYATYIEDDKNSSSYLKPVVGYGLRLWVGLGGWDAPPKR